MDDNTLIAELVEAADELDEERAAHHAGLLADRIRSGTAIEPKPARRVLTALQRKRYFALEERVARALIDTGQADARARRMYAQSLIDQGHLEKAREFLERLVVDTERATDPAKVRALAADLAREAEAGLDPAAVQRLTGQIDRELKGDGENAEARGLLGRTFKQMYVTHGGGPDALRKALEAYFPSTGRTTGTSGTGSTPSPSWPAPGATGLTRPSRRRTRAPRGWRRRSWARCATPAPPPTSGRWRRRWRRAWRWAAARRRCAGRTATRPTPAPTPSS